MKYIPLLLLISCSSDMDHIHSLAKEDSRLQYCYSVYYPKSASGRFCTYYVEK